MMSLFQLTNSPRRGKRCLYGAKHSNKSQAFMPAYLEELVD